ncbi:MAG: hypothetical protein JST16_04020 [Bdellovibrionales bacterium]|nr:hypothetical protein [Bdellovibrionales bacterium]
MKFIIYAACWWAAQAGAQPAPSPSVESVKHRDVDVSRLLKGPQENPREESHGPKGVCTDAQGTSFKLGERGYENCVTQVSAEYTNSALRESKSAPSGVDKEKDANSLGVRVDFGNSQKK